MVITSQAEAVEIGRQFARVLREQPYVRTLWVWQNDEVTEFWVITDSIDVEAEKHLYLVCDWLYDHTDAPINFHVFNPRLSGSKPEWFIPPDASRIPVS